MSTLDLFVREPESIETLREPGFTEAEANFHFRSYTQDRSKMWGSMSDEEDLIEIFEFSFPEVSGFTLKHTTTDLHYNIVSMLNAWLRKPEVKNTPEARWVIANINELNYSRKYWAVQRLNKSIADLELQRAQIDDEIQACRVKLSIDIIEARDGRHLTTEDRLRLAREFGMSA